MNKECFVKKGTSPSAALYPAFARPARTGVTNAAARGPATASGPVRRGGHEDHFVEDNIPR